MAEFLRILNITCKCFTLKFALNDYTGLAYFKTASLTILGEYIYI